MINTQKMSFRESVLNVVKNIPKGETLSYKQVAQLAGNEMAARAVGAIMRTNWDPTIPCHRVIHSDGTPGGYNRGRTQKTRLLAKERGKLA